MSPINHFNGPPAKEPGPKGNWDKIIKEVLPFAVLLKRRMNKLQKRHVRIACPNKKHDVEVVYITAALHPTSRDKEGHLHFACADPECHYRYME